MSSNHVLLAPLVRLPEVSAVSPPTNQIPGVSRASKGQYLRPAVHPAHLGPHSSSERLEQDLPGGLDIGMPLAFLSQEPIRGMEKQVMTTRARMLIEQARIAASSDGGGAAGHLARTIRQQARIAQSIHLALSAQETGATLRPKSTEGSR